MCHHNQVWATERERSSSLPTPRCLTGSLEGKVTVFWKSSIKRQQWLRQVSVREDWRGAMAAKLVCVLLVLMCCTVFGNTTASDPWDNAGVRAVLRIYDECSKTESISPCLKKKAITFLDRLSRMAKLPLSDEIVIVEADDAPTTPQQNLTDEELENSLPRDAEGRDSALDNLLYDKISSYVSSRTLRVTMPRISIASLGLPEGKLTNSSRITKSSHDIRYRAQDENERHDGAVDDGNSRENGRHDSYSYRRSFPVGREGTHNGQNRPPHIWNHRAQEISRCQTRGRWWSRGWLAKQWSRRRMAQQRRRRLGQEVHERCQ